MGDGLNHCEAGGTPAADPALSWLTAPENPQGRRPAAATEPYGMGGIALRTDAPDGSSPLKNGMLIGDPNPVL